MSTMPADLNLGPLTSAFSAPTDCNSLTVSFDGTSSYAPYAYPRLFSSIANSCFPSGYPLGGEAVTKTFAPYSYQDQHVYYSPGLCPSGWLKNTAGSNGAETTVFCCPSGFNPHTTPAVSGGASSTYCLSSVASTVITTIAYTGDGAVAGDGFTSTFTFTGSVMPAGAVWVRYKDSDFPSSASTTASGSSSTSTGLNPLGTGNFAVTPTPSGLPTGAKIGLALGIPLVVILAASIFAFIFIRRRRRNRIIDGPPSEAGTSEPQWNTSHLSQYTETTELSGEGSERPKSELPVDEAALKLLGGRSRDVSRERSELDSSEPVYSYVSELPG
ncbi:hypothetical protein D0Z07_6513 [Hyphodiscus hymeniophilus]|uniref:Uncharacterized protein n=1 Tax=Hyphodiscus hymeniophilus TaxID=353542 RepID=A0A9P6VH79_9HELO|nr:hypothetical protein D0Z07_6513 [Hyphodiscus hymeniophilus]